MRQATWILTKLGGKTGQPIICSSHHPDYSPEKWDVQIGQACFEMNWKSGRLVDVSEHIALSAGHRIFAFQDELAKSGIDIPEKITITENDLT